MQTGFYCIVQFQPDRFRREGVNIGVLVVSEEHRRLGTRFVEVAERVRRAFPGTPIDDQRLAAATRALARRLAEVEPTEEAMRRFIKSESSQLVILPPMRARVVDIDATLTRLVNELVVDPYVAPQMTCARCSIPLNAVPAATWPIVRKESLRANLEGARLLQQIVRLAPPAPRLRGGVSPQRLGPSQAWAADGSTAWPSQTPMPNLFSGRTKECS